MAPSHRPLSPLPSCSATAPVRSSASLQTAHRNTIMRTHTHTHQHTYLHMYTCLPAGIHVHTCIHFHTYKYPCTRILTNNINRKELVLQVHRLILGIHVHTCIHTHTHTRTHTHTATIHTLTNNMARKEYNQ